MSGPGADLARELLGKLDAYEWDVVTRWGLTQDRTLIRIYFEGFFFGRFRDVASMVCLSNAARAIADREVPIK